MCISVVHTLQHVARSKLQAKCSAVCKLVSLLLQEEKMKKDEEAEKKKDVETASADDDDEYDTDDVSAKPAQACCCWIWMCGGADKLVCYRVTLSCCDVYPHSRAGFASTCGQTEVCEAVQAELALKGQHDGVCWFGHVRTSLAPWCLEAVSAGSQGGERDHATSRLCKACTLEVLLTCSLHPCVMPCLCRMMRARPRRLPWQTMMRTIPRTNCRQIAICFVHSSLVVQGGGVAFCKRAGLAHVGLVMNCCVCANNLCVKVSAETC